MAQFEDTVAAMDARITELNDAITGIRADVDALKATIGQPTPEQMALLNSLSARFSTAVDGAKALDAENPAPQ